MILVMMGVTGSGKTTIGSLLAKRLNLQFADADDYHPAANKAKMAAGQPLTDEDRAPWLATLNQLLRGWQQAGSGGVLACSALKESYRQTLSDGIQAGNLLFVHLEVPKQILEQRLHERKHSFMNPALLDSQIATLEQPDQGQALFIENDRTPDEVVGEIVSRLPAASKRI